MKQIEFFLDFYNELNTPGLVLFWLIIVLFFFLFFSLIAVLLKNQELRKIIRKLQIENKKDKKEEKNEDKKEKSKASLNQRSLSIKKEDLEPIIEDSIIKPKVEPKNSVQEENDYFDLNEDEFENMSNVDSMLATNSMRKETVSKTQTSPIAIKEKDTMKIDNQKLKPIEIVDEEDDYYESVNDGNSSFVEEISKQVDDILDDDMTITDFENNQEEEAVISYEELLRNTKMAETREKRYNIDVEDDNDFLKELKSFRNDL